MVEEQIGQLIWAFISRQEDLDSAERAARQGRLSGIWLLPTQMHDPREAIGHINRLQAASPTPLLIGVDAEAGLGLVMGGATFLPTAMAIGATRERELAFQAAAVTAAEARTCGINMVAAPVLDVNVNPANPIVNTRSFGASPDLVSELGAAYVRGLQGMNGSTTGVLAIGKHFPGHGDTSEDSHLHLAAVHHSREQLEAVDLPPFRAAIAADVAMLMTAHIAYPALDSAERQPATLSRPILTDLLRHKLGFQGPVVTDCMNMHAIDHNFAPQDSNLQVVLAGGDLILSHQWDLVYDTLLAAVESGKLSQSRLAEAAARVGTVKTRLFGSALQRPEPIDPEAALAAIATPAHQALADRIAAASVTLVGGEVARPAERPVILATRVARFGQPVGAQMDAALAAVGWGSANVVLLDPVPDGEQIRAAVERVRAAGWGALLHFNPVASFDPDSVLASDALVTLAGAATDAGVPLHVASLGSPYILPRFSSARALLCGYSTCDATVRAMLRVLKGETQAPGQLSVTL